MQEYREKKKSDDSYLVLRAGVVPKLRRYLLHEVSTSELLLDLHLASKVCHTVCTGINSFQSWPVEPYRAPDDSQPL